MKKIAKFLLPFLCGVFVLTVFTGCEKEPQCFQIKSEITDNGNLNELFTASVNEILKRTAIPFEKTLKEAKAEFKTSAEETENDLNALNELSPKRLNFTVTLKLQYCDNEKTVSTKKLHIK